MADLECFPVSTSVKWVTAVSNYAVHVCHPLCFTLVMADLSS